MTGNMQGNLAPAGNMPAGGGMQHMPNFNDMSAIIGAGNIGGNISGSNMQANLMGNMPANLPSNLNINMSAMNMVSVKNWENDVAGFFPWYNPMKFSFLILNILRPTSTWMHWLMIGYKFSIASNNPLFQSD